MTTLFFALLPTDLQKDILHAWLDADDCGSSLLKVLSALDVACSMSEQPSLRFLMAQLPPFGEYSTPHASTAEVQLIAECFQWLASRHVPVRTLVLVGERLDDVDAAVVPNLTLPLIETLQWEGPSYSALDLAAVAQCLPNLTAIHQSGDHPIHFSTIITATKLKMLHLDGIPVGRNVCECIYSCSQLQELRIRHALLFADLFPQCCPYLQLLEITMFDMDMLTLRNGLLGCLCLSELKLHSVQVSKVNKLVEIVATLPNIKRLTVFGPCRYHILVNVFTDIIGRFPSLEYLRIKDLVCSRLEHRLELDVDYVTTEQVSLLLSYSDALEEVCWKGNSIRDMVALLADNARGTLKTLTIQPASLDVLNTLLQPCGLSLTSLDLNCQHAANTNGLIEIVATTCLRLVIMSIRVFDLRGSTNDDCFHVLFASCKELKEFTLDVRYIFCKAGRRGILGAILHHKLRLKLLKMVCSSSAYAAQFESDATWFRQQAKSQQLLPVPTIVNEYCPSNR